uniref:hypothetical protein RF1 n=1 Tax=Tetraselmis marina TaxID=41888 RepID=UPI0021AC7109|nr:hypothetical protein RF1 [Tetraselmis marina]YP_010455907.1 hypothetical protein RF1 [Tetraselmis marina]UUA64578.1 hypothetical protein RF1 [Tetraselmis marina]UUA64583.1 hypothetical protein RF1 [Tetraselmis marina]
MVSIIRDYLDVLSDFLNSSASYFDIIKMTFLFFCQSLSTLFQYFVTFSWFRDIMYIPLVIPKCQQAILSEHFFYEDLNVPLLETLAVLKNDIFGSFSLGFLNSFFCCLPLSTIHLLNIRRLLVQGVLAGVVSTFGLIVGQTAFIFFTIFGLRSFVIPWFSIDPLNYIMGLIILFTLVYGMANETRIRPVDVSEKGILIQIFFVSLLLAWTEQAGFGQALTNLNLTNELSLLSSGAISSMSHFGYFGGILVGHIFFSILFMGLVYLIKDGLFILSNLPYSVWLNRVNSVLLVFIIGMGCSSIPNYSLDYLATSSLGFVSQDKALENSLFAQKNVKDPSRLLTSMDVIYPFPIDTDVSYFDRGEYGEQPGYFKRSFEDLNYQGEYAWLVRRDKKPNLFASAQTTRTTIRDLFQFEPTSTTAQTNASNQDSQTINEVNKGDSKKKLLFKSISSKKGASLDRPRFKKRYDETYQETRANDSYLIGESFNTFPVLEGAFAPLEVTLKQKYYGNKVYQTLLNLEVDAFVKRQPASYLLSSDDEAQLYQKRLLLSKYHDTIREYQKVPYKDEFNEFLYGSKTFVDRAYNHQFKGTLGTVRRLFAVTLDGDDNPAMKAVLKYDQPLFKLITSDNFMHEELLSGVDKNVSSSFLEFNDSTPFYLGWNNETRQMVLTKRFSSHVDSINLDNNLSISKNRPFYQFLKTEAVQTDKALMFTTWPLQKKVAFDLKTNPKTSNNIITLFEPLSNLETSPIAQVISTTRTGNLEVFSFPANMRFFGKVPDRLAPNQGGLVWPGADY